MRQGKVSTCPTGMMRYRSSGKWLRRTILFTEILTEHKLPFLMSSQVWFKHILFLRCLDKLFLERGRERERGGDRCYAERLEVTASVAIVTN